MKNWFCCVYSGCM